MINDLQKNVFRYSIILFQAKQEEAGETEDPRWTMIADASFRTASAVNTGRPVHHFFRNRPFSALGSCDTLCKLASFCARYPHDRRVQNRMKTGSRRMQACACANASADLRRDGPFIETVI